MPVTNAEVESAMNHRRLKETLDAPVFSEEVFTALNNVGAYVRAARDGLTGVSRLFSKDIQVKILCTSYIEIPVAPET